MRSEMPMTMVFIISRTPISLYNMYPIISVAVALAAMFSLSDSFLTILFT